MIENLGGRVQRQPGNVATDLLGERVLHVALEAGAVDHVEDVANHAARNASAGHEQLPHRDCRHGLRRDAAAGTVETWWDESRSRAGQQRGQRLMIANGKETVPARPQHSVDQLRTEELRPGRRDVVSGLEVLEVAALRSHH